MLLYLLQIMSNSTPPPPRRRLEIVKDLPGIISDTAGSPVLPVDQLGQLMEENPLFYPGQREDYQIRSAVGTSIENTVGRMAHVGRTIVHYGLIGRQIELQARPDPTGVNLKLTTYGTAARQRHHATLQLPYNRNLHTTSFVVTEDYDPRAANQWSASFESVHIATNGELALAADLWNPKYNAIGPQEHLGALASLGMPLLDSLKPAALKQVTAPQAVDLFMTTLGLLKQHPNEIFTPEHPFCSPPDRELAKQTRGIRAFVESGVLKLALLNRGPMSAWETAELTSDGRTPPKLHTYTLPANPGGRLPRWEERPATLKARTVTQEQLLAAKEIVQMAGNLSLDPVTANQRRIAKEQWGFTAPQDSSYIRRQQLNNE